MTSFLVAVKGATHAGGPASPQSNKVGLPRGVSLCDIVRQAGRGSCTAVPSTSTSIQWSNYVECATSSTRSKLRRGSYPHVRCYLARESGQFTEEKPIAVSENEILSSGEEDRKPLTRLSHFLRELARQDVWAGWLDPFQSVGGNSSEVNYFIQELKLRNAASSCSDMNTSTTPDFASQLGGSSSTAKISVLEDKGTSSSAPVGFFHEGDGVFHSGTRIDVATAVDSGSDLLSYAAEAASGVKKPGLFRVPVSTSSRDSVVLEASTMEAAKTRATSNPIAVEDAQVELCARSASCVTAAEIGSVDNLARWLEERIGTSIINQWGVAPGTKHVANLWCELVEGEISLEDSRPPKRSTHVMSVKIKNDQGHVLVEAYQEMADGRRRPRNRPLSEKMRPGERVEEACLRGIFEELGCHLGASERVVMVPESYGREEEERESFSYPGLPTRYVIHTMVAHIQQLPSTEFSTEEDESGHGGSPAGIAALKGSGSQKKAVGVKRHFWTWVPETQLAELCRR